MTGLDILKHSWGMAWRNKANAARISVVLMLISLVIGTVLGLFPSHPIDPLAGVPQTGFSPQELFAEFVRYITSLIIGAWIAVAWHRYVLLNETPTGWLPKWRGSEVMLYALWILLMGVGAMIALVPVLGSFVSVIMQAETETDPNMGMAVIIAVVAVCFVTWLMVAMTRLSPVLVSRALGQKLSVKQAWGATRGTNRVLFGVYFWMFLVGIGIAIVIGIGFAALSAAELWNLMIVLWLLLSLFGTWLGMLVQVSIMTTIYGVYVEGRDLPHSGGKLA